MKKLVGTLLASLMVVNCFSAMGVLAEDSIAETEVQSIDPVIVYQDVSTEEMPHDDSSSGRAVSKYTREDGTNPVVSGGYGWDENSWWNTTNKTFSATVPTATNRTVRSYKKSDGETVYLLGPQAGAAAFYRKLADENAIKANEDAEYYISFISKNAMGSLPADKDGKISTADNRFIIGKDGGDNSFYVSSSRGYLNGHEGYTGETGYYPALSVGGKTQVGTKKIENGKLYNNLIYIKTSSAGEEVIKYQIVAENETFDPNVWDLEASAELGDSVYNYFGIQSANEPYEYATNAQFNGCAQAGAFRLEKYTDSTDALLVCNRMNEGSADENEVRNVLKSAWKYATGMVKDLVLPKILETAQADNPDFIQSKLENSNIKDGSTVHAQDIETAVLEFDYPFEDENSLEVSVRSGDTDFSVDAVNVENGKVTIIPSQIWNRDASYTICITSGANIYGADLSGFELTFHTSILPMFNVWDQDTVAYGSTFSWEEIDGVTVTAQITDEQGVTADIPNGGIIESEGNCTIKITAQSGEIQVEKVISLTVLRPYKPQAVNVKIQTENSEDKVATGTVLTGYYEINDENGDEEHDVPQSRYQWYRVSTAASEPTELDKIPGATQKTYQLTENDENQYLIFEVTPVVDSEQENTGDPVFSPAFCGAFAPVVDEVKFKGSAEAGKELEVEYKISDLNGDEDLDKPEFAWFYIDDSGEHQIDGAKDSKLMITPEYFDKELIVKITPKSIYAPVSGETKSSEKILTPSKPVIENVKINGKARVGNSIYVTYDFKDPNQDQAGQHIIEWINEKNDSVIATSAALELKPSHADMKIAVRVTPVSAQEPFKGEPVTSDAVTVADEPRGGSSGGGGGGGFGYIGSSSGTIKNDGEDTEDNNNTMTDNEPTDNPEPSGFTDIKGHWAESYINDLTEKDIISGRNETTFEPEGEITRAEFLTLLMRTKEDEKVEFAGSFADVHATDWFASDVETALANGYISADENFRPNDKITREEAAKLITLIMEISMTEEEKTEFADNDSISSWAEPYVSAVNQAGIMVGNENNEFMPSNSLLRGEAAAIVYRILNEYK